MDLLSLKKEVHKIGLSLLQDKMKELKSELDQYQQASNNETKSSAGDKYETSRAMMQLEKDKVASLLNQLHLQQKVLSQINVEKSSDEVALGSLVETSNGIFYMSASLGKLKASSEVFCISPVAPLGKALVGARTGEYVQFNTRSYQIVGVA